MNENLHGLHGLWSKILMRLGLRDTPVGRHSHTKEDEVIEYLLEFCNKRMHFHRRRINAYFMLIGFVVLVNTYIIISYGRDLTSLENYKLLIAMQYGGSVIIIGILTSLYKLHSKQHSKYEFLLFGTYRNWLSKSWVSVPNISDIMRSLTINAFEPEFKPERNQKRETTIVNDHPLVSLSREALSPEKS